MMSYPNTARQDGALALQTWVCSLLLNLCYQCLAWGGPVVHVLVRKTPAGWVILVITKQPASDASVR